MTSCDTLTTEGRESPASRLSVLGGSWMTRPTGIVAPGGRMGLAMQLILTPRVLRFMDRQRRAA